MNSNIFLYDIYFLVQARSSCSFFVFLNIVFLNINNFQNHIKLNHCNILFNINIYKCTIISKYMNIRIQIRYKSHFFFYSNILNDLILFLR